MALCCTREGSGWINRKNFFSERVVLHWHRVPGGVQSPSLEVSNNCGDVALRDVGWVSGNSSNVLGLDLMILEVFSNLNDSVLASLLFPGGAKV